MGEPTPPAKAIPPPKPGFISPPPPSGYKFDPQKEEWISPKGKVWVPPPPVPVKKGGVVPGGAPEDTSERAKNLVKKGWKHDPKLGWVSPSGKPYVKQKKPQPTGERGDVSVATTPEPTTIPEPTFAGML